MTRAIFVWFDRRLHLQRFADKFLAKTFPSHPSYLLGELILFCFVVLALTGIFLGVLYEPSSRLVGLFGKMVPAAFASVVRIDYTALGLIIRRLHHWSAMIMVGAVFAHLFRIFFTAAYRNPREANWLVGVGLLGFTLFAAFTGYLLPYSEFSVTATSIGYYIAKSTPWLGDWLARLLFSGEFPSDGSIPRFFFMHVMLIPFGIAGLVSIHLLLLVKQKHTEPWANQLRREAESGKQLLGMPLWPQQTLVSLSFFFIFLAVLMVLASFVPINPVETYGPPRPGTPVMRPDWYFLSIYGLLKLIPGNLHFNLPGASITSETIGGVLVPGLAILVLLLLPFLDRSAELVHYNARLRERPLMTSIGIAAILVIILLMVAGYIDVLYVTRATMWGIVIVPTVVLSLAVYLFLKRLGQRS